MLMHENAKHASCCICITHLITCRSSLVEEVPSVTWAVWGAWVQWGVGTTILVGVDLAACLAQAWEASAVVDQWEVCLHPVCCRHGVSSGPA